MIHLMQRSFSNYFRNQKVVITDLLMVIVTGDMTLYFIKILETSVNTNGINLKLKNIVLNSYFGRSHIFSIIWQGFWRQMLVRSTKFIQHWLCFILYAYSHRYCQYVSCSFSVSFWLDLFKITSKKKLN